MEVPTRFVDTLPVAENPKPIEVIVLGLSRTGTMSMWLALKKLGFRSYHMTDAMTNAREGHLTMWNEAVPAKYGPGLGVKPLSSASPATPYARADLGKLLKGYDALTDAPNVLFVPELLDAYPDAHLVLTTHPGGPDGWVRSIRNSYFRVVRWSVWSWLLMLYDTAFSLPYMTLVRRILEIWTATPWPACSDFDAVEHRLREFYAVHNAKMRNLAREQGRPLLEFDPKNGWAQLCGFLSKEVPSEPYPHANEGHYAANIHMYVVALRLYEIFGKRFLIGAGATAAAGIAWYCVPK